MFLRHLLLVLFLSYLCAQAMSQTITTIAGTPGVAGNKGEGGIASSAFLAKPYGIGVDDNGNIYIGDWFNWSVRKISNTGIITTFAGGAGISNSSGDGGPALNTWFNVISDIDFDSEGNIYLMELGGPRVRKINKLGIITTVAGNGTTGSSNIDRQGDGGPATMAPLYDPNSIAIDKDGNIFIVEPAKNSIRKVNKAGIISTIAGLGFYNSGYTGDGGPASLAKMNSPIDIAVDKNGNLFIAELGNHIIRKIDASGIITTFAGTGVKGYSGDGGPAIKAKLNRPFGVAVDNAGNVYIAEDSNHVIRKVSANGIITTIGGTGVEGYSGDGGPAIKARLTVPERLCVDNDGNIYFTDWVNHTVRKISACKNAVVSSLSIIASATSVCADEFVTFTAIPVNGGMNPFFEWSVNGLVVDNNKSSFVTNNLKDGDVISCTMTGNTDCAVPVNSVNSIRINVNELPLIKIPAEIIIEPGSSVQLNPQVTGIILNTLWSPSQGLNNPLIINPIASPRTTTAYTIKVMTVNGCTSEAKTTVVVYKRLLMPNAFTPNGDGLNDVFRIPAGTTMSLTDFSVFDRWGNLIFKTNNIYQGWNGRRSNFLLPSGNYVYTITGNDPRGKVFVKGTVLLVR
jgi:gliding motility-associated-like protein